MTAEGSLIVVYLVYVPVAVALTVWLARTLHRHGTVFLDEVFADQPDLATAINRLLVTGFYMLNLGYAFLILRAEPAGSAVGAMEELVTKLGLLLVSLAVLHFVNVLVFERIRRRVQIADAPPPVPPSAAWYPTAPAPPGAPAGQAQDVGGQWGPER